jgi:AbiJ N-terminal domain 4
MFENVFSRRKGYTPSPVQGKLEELSRHARNRLWDIFQLEFFQQQHVRNYHGNIVPGEPLKRLFMAVWTDLYHRPSDEFPGGDELLQNIRENFLEGDWHFPFDIFEAIFSSPQYFLAYPGNVADKIRDALERENQAYTFVGVGSSSE